VFLSARGILIIFEATILVAWWKPGLKVVILAGGYGKRLRPLTSTTPKPLIEVAGKPIIEWQIEWLKSYGFKEIVVLIGYLREKIIEKLGSGSRFGVKMVYVVEDEPLGTGGALKNAEHILRGENEFIVVNGDIITNLNPAKLLEPLRSSKNIVGVIAAIPLRSPYGVIDISDDGRILGFREKPMIKDYWMNAGVYAFKPEILEYLPKKGDIEKTAFPRLAEEGKLYSVKFENVYWRSIDTHKDIEEASRELNQTTIFARSQP